MATFYQTERDTTYLRGEEGFIKEEAMKKGFYHLRRILNSYTLFHFSFSSVLLLELFSLGSFLCFDPRSLILPLLLGAFVLTLFSYWIMHSYFQGKRIEQFRDISKSFFHTCEKEIRPDVSEEEFHLALAKNSFEFVLFIGQKAIYVLSLPPFQFVQDIVIKIRYFLHAKDVKMMQELLMKKSLEEYVRAIVEKPTDLQIHTSLAEAYIAFSKIYTKQEEIFSKESRFVSYFIKKLKFEEKFKALLEQAVEELLVIDSLSPNDPWTHAELAHAYHFLGKIDLELKEYELLSELRPKDKEILLRLGSLYFKLGKKGKGLIVYNQLKKLDQRYADFVIQSYGAQMSAPHN